MELINKFLTASRIDGFINNEEVIAATNVTIANEYAMKLQLTKTAIKELGL